LGCTLPELFRELPDDERSRGLDVLPASFPELPERGFTRAGCFSAEERWPRSFGWTCCGRALLSPVGVVRPPDQIRDPCLRGSTDRIPDLRSDVPLSSRLDSARSRRSAPP
jgi:hypothetical protein